MVYRIFATLEIMGEGVSALWSEADHLKQPTNEGRRGKRNVRRSLGRVVDLRNCSRAPLPTRLKSLGGRGRRYCIKTRVNVLEQS